MVQKKTAAVLFIVLMGIGYFSFLIFADLTSQPTTSTQSIINTWTFDTDDDIYSSPAIVDVDGDGNLEVIAGSDDNTIYAINAEDGSPLWSFVTMGDITTAPAIADLDNDHIPEIVAAGADGSIHVLNGEDGSRLWTPPQQNYFYEGNMAYEGEEHRYQVSVDSGAEEMRLLLGCGNNDYDLYVGYGYEPSTGDYDYRGYTTTGEDITIAAPNEGIWHFMVRSYSGTGEYQFSISINYEGETEDKSFQFQGTLENEGDVEYHNLTIPDGTTYVNMILSCGENDFDLYGALGYTPTTSNYDFRGFSSGGEDLTFETLDPGDWVLMVHAYDGTGPYRIVISMTVSTSVMSGVTGNLVGDPVIADILGDNDQKVILATKEGNVYCMEGETGEVFWTHHLLSEISSSPVVSDVNGDGILDVIAATHDGWLIAIDGQNGTEIWYNGEIPVASQGFLTADANDDGTEDVILSAGGRLLAIDGSTGTEIWSTVLSTSELTVPSVIIGYTGEVEIIVGAADGSLYKVGIDSGDTLWVFSNSGGIASAPCVADVSGDGFLDIIFTDTSGKIKAIDSSTRELFWEVSIPGANSTYLAIADIGHDSNLDIVACSDTNKIYAFEVANSGQRIFWQGSGGDSLFTRAASLRIVDADGDMLSTYSEAFYGCSPNNNDTDSDQILDGIEISMGLSPILPDTDFDTLSDFEETYIYLTSGNNPDTDNDLLTDNLEILVYLTDPLSNDSDHDNLSDGLEVLVYGSSPLLVDSDNDTILDGLEVNVYGSSPAAVDTDLDTISDYDEIFVHHTNPNATDTDQDLLSDAAELNVYLSNPLVADSDSDGAIDGVEAYTIGSEVLIADTDGDSYLDGWEYAWGFDPLDGNVVITEPLLFYGPYLLVAVAVGIIGYIVVRWERSDKDEDDVSVDQDDQGVPDIPKDTVYDLMDGVEKPWLYDGRDPLMQEGDIHDFMQWLVKEENYANALIDGGALREGVARLEKLLGYVEQERDLLTHSRGPDTYNRTWERIAKRVDELRTVLN